MNTSRCDLHVHSTASVGNDEWYTRLFGCPESYADPVRQYDLCKARGMTLVTLTDHDTIAGGLQLVDRPDFFLSEEVTTAFPENDCVMHVLVWNITPPQHEEIQARRQNIYGLCEYLNSRKIAHGLAHPLLSPNWRLDTATFEKALLLFPVLEGINGLTDRRIEQDLTTIVDRLTPEAIRALSHKHGILPFGAAPHRKAMTAGSDDHVHRRCGTVYTELDGAKLTPGDFIAGCMSGAGRAVGTQAHLHTMAMTVQNTAYHFLKPREVGTNTFRNPFVEMVDLLGGRGAAEPGAGGLGDFLSSMKLSLPRTSVALGQGSDLLQIPIDGADQADARVIDGISQLSNKVIERALGEIIDAAQDFDLYRIFAGLRDIASGLVTAAPLFFAADHFGRQEQQVRNVWRDWHAFPVPRRPQRLAIFSDSLEQVDGVSTWCGRFVERARAAGREALVPHCGELPTHVAGRDSFHQLPALTTLKPPFYPGLRFHVPSPIDTFVWAWNQGITHVELSTPGPMGLVGLLVAKVLRLPVTASYHTEVPALLQSLGGSAFLERAARRYLSWFYGQVDRTFAFSKRSRDMLVEMGVKPEKLELMPVAVDPHDFSPSHHSPSVFESLNLDVGCRPVVLSVGRLSAEKCLPMIIEAVESLQHLRPAPLLLIVGDGPDRAVIEALCRQKDFVRFAGLQQGSALRQIYASARMFVFAGRIDTLGLVNMEAMSSGIPALVPRDASIADSVTHGLSAEFYEFGAEGLATAIAGLLTDPKRARRLSEGGRAAMMNHWKEASFSRIWTAITQHA
jgi:glycosyltransferase involved in cell wall biosynthesis